MFAIVSMMRVTIGEIGEKKLPFWKVWKHCKSPIHSVGNVGNEDLNYFALVSMMRTTGVEIS